MRRTVQNALAQVLAGAASVGLALVACGTSVTPPPYPPLDPPGVGGEQGGETLDAVASNEPTLDALTPETVAGTTPLVDMAHLSLPAGAEWRVPSRPCADVLVIVREGAIQATGAGVAAAEGPATLAVSGAARFGPEGDGVLRNAGDTEARAVVVTARSRGGDGCTPATESDRPRSAAFDATPVLTAANGKMRVRILLDAQSNGARLGALSVLEGDADVAVPEHTHDGSAEVLLIEEGEGTMKLGDRELTVRPGMMVYVPEGTVHDFRGAGTGPLRAIQVYSPSGPEQRFRQPAPRARAARQ